jgi:hypothetical protein
MKIKCIDLSYRNQLVYWPALSGLGKKKNNVKKIKISLMFSFTVEKNLNLVRVDSNINFTGTKATQMTCKV